MEKELQDNIRIKVIEAYSQRAWDSLLNYQYWGNKYSVIEKQVNDYQDRIAHFEKVVKEIKALPDHHSVENRKKAANAQRDVDAYRSRIKGMEPLITKLQEQAVKWQQQGVEYLELIDLAKEFKVRTPQEIEDAKVGAPAAEPVVAGEKIK